MDKRIPGNCLSSRNMLPVFEQQEMASMAEGELKVRQECEGSDRAGVQKDGSQTTLIAALVLLSIWHTSTFL